jgi:heme/copper-type cytochrome/quinol oxidase subunit 3
VRFVVGSEILALNVIRSGLVTLLVLVFAVARWEDEQPPDYVFGGAVAALLAGLFLGLAVAAWVTAIALGRWFLVAGLFGGHVLVGLAIVGVAVERSTRDEAVFVFVVVWLVLESVGLIGLVAARAER